MIKVSYVLKAVEEEVARAMIKHPRPSDSFHEGYAVLLEEVDELWDEVKKKSSERDLGKLREEAIQVAAMAVRFISELL